MKNVTLVIMTIMTSMLLSAGPREPAGAISGQVRNKDGSPAVGIRVSALTSDPGAPAARAVSLAGFAETDAAGRYRIQALPPGGYYVAAGFLDSPTYLPGVITIEEARRITVTADTTVTGADMTLARSAGVRVAGRVPEFPAGMPAGFARFSLEPFGVRSAKLETAVRADGTFEFSRIGPGTYVPRLSLFDKSVATYPSFVVDDGDVTGFTATLPRVVLGLVEVEGGAPLPPASQASLGDVIVSYVVLEIRALGTKDGIATTMARADNGGFVSSLPKEPGDYQVVIRMLPVGHYVRSLSSGSVNLLENPLRIGAMPIDPIRLTLTTTPPPNAPREVKVRGRVIGLPEVGAPGAVVILSRETPLPDGSPGDRSDFAEAPILADGSFELQHIAPGAWILVAQGGGVHQADLLNVTVGDRDLAGIEVAITFRRPPPPPPPPSPPAPRQPPLGRLIVSPGPIIPPEARSVSGTVTLSLLVDKDGSVKEVTVLRGPEALRQTSIDAVRQWRYEPAVVDGAPVEGRATVSITFKAD